MAGIFDMKRTTLLLLIGIFLLSACGGTASLSPTSIPNNSTSTSLPTATGTQTLLPSSTSTLSITPLPTIPTFTPTFDASTIVTVTPAPKVECPKEDPTLKPDLKDLFTQEGLQSLKDQALLDFLNMGGAPNSVITSFLQEFAWFHPNMGIQQDVTGDAVDEFILTDGQVVYVFGCIDGKYQIWLRDTDDPMWLQLIDFSTSYDMNLNGVLEG